MADGSEPTLVSSEQIAALDQGSGSSVSAEGQGGPPAGSIQSEQQGQPSSPEGAEPNVPSTPALSRVEAARALNFALPDDATDDQVNTALAQLQSYAQIGREFKQNPQQFAGYFKQSQEVATPAAPAQQVAPAQASDPFAWPSIDPAIAAQCVIDPETGIAKARHDLVPAQVVQQVNQYLYEKEHLHDEFTKNPIKFTFDRIREPLLNEMREELRKEFQAQQYESQQQAFNDEITDKYYATDASGNYMISPMTGEYAPSQWGQVYMNSLYQAAQMGATDTLQMQKWAAAQADAVAAPKQRAVPAVPPEQVSQQKKEAFLGGATVNGNSGYSANNPSVNERINGLSAGQLENFFVDRARAAGVYQDVN